MAGFGLVLGGLLAVGSALAQAPEGEVQVAGYGSYYVIQTGDTLWGISGRFLGDSYAWPELWSVNPYITNPHWIYPGNRVYFTLGSALDMAGLGSDALSVGEVASTRRMDACDFDPMFYRQFNGVQLDAPGVLASQEQMEFQGVVEGADVNGRNLGEGTYLYLKMEDARDVECGQVVGIYQKMTRRRVKVDGRIYGHVWRVAAMAQVVRVDGDVVTARIRDSYTEVERGFLVGQPMAVSVELDVTEPDRLEERGATVVARLSTPEQRLASTQETLFLDRGTDDGLEVGTSLYIVEQRDGTNLDGPEQEDLPERVVGRVVVVRADRHQSTGVVVDASRDVQPGARLVSDPNND